VLRDEHRYENDAFLMFYAAEFNANKNQQLLIKSVSLVKEEVPKAKLLLAGEGSLLEECKELARSLGVEHMVDFLGFRKDIESLLKMSNIVVASSKREGLPVNIMEAMACGLPIIALKNRGHCELVKEDCNGWIVSNQPEELAKKVAELAKNQELQKQMGEQSRKIMLDSFSLVRVLAEKKELYVKVMSDMEEVQWAIH
jgi:glycosyltransferase EpsD